MSRNVDKANSVLVRYQELQAEEAGGYKDYSRYKRPTKVSSVRTLKEAQEWKKQLVGEIKSKTSRIYDPSLNDVQLTELNDELNELFKENTQWDWHISNRLGGGKWNKAKGQLVGGQILFGKRYFGRAMELPEAKELLRKEKEQQQERLSNANLVDTKRIPKNKNSLYYKGAARSTREQQELQAYMSRETAVLQEFHDIDPQEIEGINEPPFEVPTLKEVETWLVERRKRKLLEQLDL